MTAVCPLDSSPGGAGAGAAESRESNGDSSGGSMGGTGAVAGAHRYTRWSRQDSSDINTDDEGVAARTPLERLNLEMCQDER